MLLQGLVWPRLLTASCAQCGIACEHAAIVPARIRRRPNMARGPRGWARPHLLVLLHQPANHLELLLLFLFLQDCDLLHCVFVCIEDDSLLLVERRFCLRVAPSACSKRVL